MIWDLLCDRYILLFIYWDNFTKAKWQNLGVEDVLPLFQVERHGTV
jgi:hypothetical protein